MRYNRPIIQVRVIKRISRIILINANDGFQMYNYKLLARSVLRFLLDDDGATAIEYGLIAALIVAAIVGVLVTLGPKVANLFTTVENNF